jgi:hypothetical protein
MSIKIKFLTTSILLLLLGSGLNAQQSVFSKVFYDIIGSEQAYSIAKTTDNSYMIAGESDYSGLIMKIDTGGNLLWSKKFGNDNNTRFTKIIAASGSNFAAAGKCLNATNSTTDIFCVKFNINGDTLWSKSIDFGNSEYATSIATTIDKGFIISGINQQFTTTPYGAMVIIKLDSAGNVNWMKKLSPGDHDNYAFSVKQTPDSGYVVAGYFENSLGGSLFDIRSCLIKLSSSGNVLWAKNNTALPANSYLWAYDIAVSNTALYWLSGMNNGSGVIIMKTDFSGNTVWSKNIMIGSGAGSIGNSTPRLNLTADDGLVYTYGDTFSPGYFFKIDSAGNMLWEKFVYLIASDVIETSDTGFILVGNGPIYGVKHVPTNNPQIGIIKTDSSGNSDCMFSDSGTAGNISLTFTSFSCVATAGGVIAGRHPVVTDITLSAMNDCVNFLGGINENEKDDAIFVYPNPNDGLFNLELPSALSDFSLSITDVLGRTVYQKSFIHYSNEPFDISDQPNGLYYIVVNSNNKLFKTKIVINK